MLKIKFNPNNNLLTVTSKETTKFHKKILLGLWESVLDLNGNKLFYIQVELDGTDFVVNIEGLDENERPADYDISDLLSAQKISVMPMSKKFLYLVLKITNGEYEYYSKSVHQVNPKIDKEKFSEKYAKTFYSGKAENNDGTYYFNGGEVAVEVYKIEEVTFQEYLVLNKFL